MTEIPADARELLAPAARPALNLPPLAPLDPAERAMAQLHPVRMVEAWKARALHAERRAAELEAEAAKYRDLYELAGEVVRDAHRPEGGFPHG